MTKNMPELHLAQVASAKGAIRGQHQIQPNIVSVASKWRLFFFALASLHGETFKIGTK